MDPNKSVFLDEPKSNEISSSTKKTAIPLTTSGKSKTPWMALGDLVDDQVHPFVIRLEKTTIDPKIEKLYGPFEDIPVWAYPPLAAAPKPLHPANNTQQATNSKGDLTSEITRLKALIAERQRNNTKQRLEQRPPPQQQSSPVKMHVAPPSAPIISSSYMAPMAPPASSTPVDLTTITKVDQDCIESQPELLLDSLQHSQASDIFSSSTSSPQLKKAIAAATTSTLTSSLDINPVQKVSLIPSTAEQHMVMDSVQGKRKGKGKADDHDQLLGTGTSTESSHQMERMETMQANVSTLNGASEDDVGNGSVNYDYGHTTTRLHGRIFTNQVESASRPTLENDTAMTHTGNSENSKNNINRGITLSDSDSDLDDDEDEMDYERTMLRSEEEKHEGHLAEIRQLQAETDNQLDGMVFERRKLEKYIRKISTPVQQERQKQHVSDSPACQREAALIGLALNHSEKHRKESHLSTTEQISTSQKRQKISDSRSAPQPPSGQRSFGNNHPTNMMGAQSSTLSATRIGALNNNSSSSNTIPIKASTKSYNKSANDHQKNEIKPLSGGMDVADYFKEFSDLVRNRAIIDSELERLSTPTNSNAGIKTHRKPPQIEKLITLDDLTFSCDSFRLLDGMKKRIPDIENHEPLRYSESLLLAMKMDGIPRIPSIPPPVRQSLRDILAQAPKDFKTSLLHYKNGQLLSGLDAMLDTNLAAIRTHGNLELLWATYTELMVYRHGYSDELASAVLKAQQYHPFSLDIYWQTIFAAPQYSSRCALITEILKSISASRSSPNFNGESTSVSEKSTEILLRTLKYNGIRGIIDQLLPTTNVNLSDAGRLLKISLSSTPSYIFITDHDLCYLWMSVVVYYVYGQLHQDTNRRHWFDRASESGEITPITNTLFLIDWTKIPPQLLNDEEQTVVVTILLEMLSYFCQKARSNGAKKSLLVTVWRNLVGCLEILKCYGPPGTLMLLKRNMQATWKIKALQPEMADMTFELEKKITKHQQIDMDPLCNKVLKSIGTPMKQLPAELFLAYRSALGLEPNSGDGDWKLLMVAWRLGRPLWQIYNFVTLSKLDNMKAIVVKDSTEPPRDLAFVQINYLCGLYSSALGVADSFEMLQVSKFRINEFRKMPLGWINALMVHLIHYWLTRDPFLVQSFLKEVSSPDIWNNMTGKDGRFLFMRFKKDCEKLIKN